MNFNPFFFELLKIKIRKFLLDQMIGFVSKSNSSKLLQNKKKQYEI